MITNNILDPKIPAYILPIPHNSLILKYGKDKFKPILFQVLPEVKESSIETEYESIEPLGRIGPILLYNRTSGIKLNISTVFFAQDRKFDTIWAHEQVNRLKALSMPIYNRNNMPEMYYAPCLCRFTYGHKYVNIPILITSVEVEPGVDGANMIEYPSSTDATKQIKLALDFALSVSIECIVTYPYGEVPGYINYVSYYDSTTYTINIQQLQ